MSANDSADFELLVSRSSILEKHTRALRLFVGRGRRYSVEDLHHATGVPRRAIECAICWPSNPEHRALKPEYLASIAKFLGARFASVYLELSGLGAFELFDGQIPLPGVLAAGDVEDLDELGREAAGFTAEYVEAKSDGLIDERERASLQHRAANLRRVA